ncbi:MAG TPA: hypothetical protein VG943_16555, partial [Caulobacterales bacterium]|nr:hypothetical protein [Caulobacterales bacterium]
MRKGEGQTRVVIRVALDPLHWRAENKAGWAMQLAAAAEAGAPHLLEIESYEITDTLVHIRMRSDAHVRALRRRLRDDDAIKR